MSEYEAPEEFPRAKRTILFAIDYDGTFSADPALFRLFVNLLRAHGHESVLVTGRSDEGPFGAEVKRAVGNLMPIVFAAGDWKKEAAAKAGYKIDVWIDDHPEYVARQNLVRAT